PIPVRAAGFTVNSPIDAPDANPGDGICATAAGLCSLRAAIQEANATPTADTITVPPGTYVLSLVGRGEDLAATGDLDIRGPLSIIGAGPASTIIDGNAADRIFHIIGPIGVQLTGLTLRNGSVPRPADISADGGGGAIYVVGGGSLTLTNVAVSGSNATSGAIAIDDGGALTMTSSTISGNNAHIAGGVLYVGGASTTLSNVTLASNTADLQGSSIMNSGGSAQAHNSILASISGGANCVGLISSLGYNLDSSQTCGLSGPGDVIGVNPQLGPLQNNGGATLTQALPPLSPAIDAGNPASPRSGRGA